MAKDKGNKARKGVFSDARLPVSKSYVYPGSRKMMFFVGGGGALLIAALFTFNIVAQQGTLASNGPLSSNHAAFSDDCSTCHDPLDGVSNAKCSTCHEKYGDDVGVHTFTAHYLYRTGDFTRVVPQTNEGPCFQCHTEHVGRENPITNVSDDQCLACHEFGSFNDDHPEFQFAREEITDESNLKFPHGLHVIQVRARQDLNDVEQTCLYCHNPEPDGKNFAPLSFETHCSACHLTSVVATDWLETTTPSTPDVAGVYTLQTIQQLQGPGSIWSYYVNPGDFRPRGEQIRKSPVYHEDRWILENLKRLRRTLYPTEGGLADLIDASPDADPRNVRQVYEEALATLETYAAELRNQPDRRIQSELDQIEGLMATVRARLRDPYASLDETRFTVSRADLNPNLTQEQIDALDSVVDRLTSPCQKCHVVENATIVRAQADQNQLFRADFDHRAHIIQMRCLDCHNKLPVTQAFNTGSVPDRSVDHAGIQNLPTIETCQTCHAKGKASNTCVTCHAFHPDKSQHSNLLRYLQ